MPDSVWFDPLPDDELGRLGRQIFEHRLTYDDRPLPAGYARRTLVVARFAEISVRWPGRRSPIRDTIIFVSVASAWEIATKWRIGKLDGIGDPTANYKRLMARNGFSSLPVTEDHALKAGILHGDHRDPFDRLIAAQALVERLIVITRDDEIAAFGCKTRW